jgi:hypothetical protein
MKTTQTFSHHNKSLKNNTQLFINSFSVGIVCKNDILSTFRSQVFDELHSDVSKHHSTEEIGPRIAALTYFLMDSDVSTCFNV